MLAVLGHIITTKGDRIPGNIVPGVPFASIKNGLAAFEDIPVEIVAAIVIFIGFLDIGFSKVEEEIAEASCASFVGRNLFLRGGLKKKQTIELNNGRAAMMGILALMVHETLNNEPYVINSLLGVPVAFN
jgi:hypothetical protein